MIPEHIPAGYQIHFTTWENDADSYSTCVWSGIQSPVDVAALLSLANRFQSTNQTKGGLGNESIGTDALIGAIQEWLATCPMTDQIRTIWMQETEELDLEDDEDRSVLADRWYELLTDRILDSPFSEHYYCEPRFCRVYSSAKVYYVPIEIQDVSDRFPQI